METEFNISVNDDTFNKKKISTLLKAKTETSSFRVYINAPQCLIKHLILSRGFHGSDEKKKMVSSLLSDEIHEMTSHTSCNRQSLLANKTNYS